MAKEVCVYVPGKGRVCVDKGKLPRPFIPRLPDVRGFIIATALAYALVRLDGGRRRGR